MRTPFLPAEARWPSAGRELMKWSRSARSRRRADRIRRTRVRYARKASKLERLASTEPRRHGDRRERQRRVPGPWTAVKAKVTVVPRACMSIPVGLAHHVDAVQFEATARV